jgi:tetratricopeptide (TPR) repeat protein
MSEANERSIAFTAALKALSQGATDAAAEIATGLAQRAPQDASVRQLMAAVAIQKSEPAVAESWALSSLAVRPDHYPTLLLAAQAARALGHLPAALGRFTRASELEPGRPEAAFGAAMIAISVKPGGSGPIVEDLLRRFPENGAGWAEIGRILERSGQFELAVDAFAAAMKTQPSANLYLRAGSALQALGRRGEAATFYQKALQLDPDSAEVWFKLGLSLQDGRQPDRAAEAYQRALALRPDLAEAETNLGVVLQEMRDIDGAKLAYGRAIQLMPSAFGRVAQALATAPKGELWLDPTALRAHLSEFGRLSR